MRSNCCTLSGLAVTALLVAELPAGAIELFAKPAGTGTACTQSSPCALADAVAAAANGDRIYVAAGVYTGTGSEVVLLDKAVSLDGGWDGAAAGTVVIDRVPYESVIDGEGVRRGVKITGGSARLGGITVRNGNASGLVECGSSGGISGCGGGVYVGATDVRISGCRVESNVADSAVPAGWAIGKGGGIMGYYAHGLTIDSNVIAGNLGSAQNAGQGGGISLEGGRNVRIASNYIVGNTATLGEKIAGQGGGISFEFEESGSTSIVEANVLDGNRAAPAGWASGNSFYTWYHSANVRGNFMSSDSLETAVYLGFFGGTFAGNTVMAGAENEVIALVNGYEDGYSLVNNVLVAGPGAERVVHVGGYAEHPVAATLKHNTIVGNTLSIGVLAGDYATVTMTNSIVCEHAKGLETAGNGTIIADHTLLSGNTENPILGTDFFFGDLPFVNRAAGDFHIGVGSAVRGAGVDAGVATDIEGNPRPGVGGFDLGAFEVGPREFDFGTATSPVAAGWVQVQPATVYTPARGFGWLSGSLDARDRGSETDLQRDFVFTKEATFAVDLPEGRYTVWLTMGDRTFGHNQMGVFLEGVQVATVTTGPGQFFVRDFPVTVTDGQLTVLLKDLGGSDPNVVVNGLQIVGDIPRRFDLGTAGSPVAPGYARVTPASAWMGVAGFGWGGGVLQARDRGTADPLLRDFVFTPRGLFRAYVANGVWDVTVTLGDAATAHDQMGISIQGAPFTAVTTAKNQFVTRTWRAAVADNRLDVLLDDLGGSDPNVVVNAIEIAHPGFPSFDFGTPGSPVAPGYLQVTEKTAFSDGRGYGWTAGTVASRDRGIGSDLQRDLNFSHDATFSVAVVPVRYDVTVTLGDAAARHDLMGVYLEGALVDTVTTAAGAFATATYQVLVKDGTLDLRLADQGGTDPNVAIVALEIR